MVEIVHYYQANLKGVDPDSLLCLSVRLYPGLWTLY